MSTDPSLSIACDTDIRPAVYALKLPSHGSDRQTQHRSELPLVDTYGRIHRDLRISVTDQCNLRCRYCMPADRAQFAPQNQLLDFDQIETVAQVAARLGISKVRITGGEPLLRNNLCDLVRRLAGIKGIDDLALTTNGMLLPRYARALKAAGLGRLNISLDAIDEESFRIISRRCGVGRVLTGIAAARQAGFSRIKLNAVAVKGLSESQIVPLARFARDSGLQLRFIEYMPFDADGRWSEDQVIPGEKIRRLLSAEIAPLVPVAPRNANQPASEFRFVDGHGSIGLIPTVTEPFCRSCNRIRLSATGGVSNCLFSSRYWDLRPAIAAADYDWQIERVLRQCVFHKGMTHDSSQGVITRPGPAMYQIGG